MYRSSDPPSRSSAHLMMVADEGTSPETRLVLSYPHDLFFISIDGIPSIQLVALNVTWLQTVEAVPPGTNTVLLDVMKPSANTCKDLSDPSQCNPLMFTPMYVDLEEGRMQILFKYPSAYPFGTDPWSSPTHVLL